MTQTKLKIQNIIPLLGIAGVLVAAKVLLGTDFSVYLTWGMMLLMLGIGVMPVSNLLFHEFHDKGWIFSKIIGIALTGWLTWLLVSLGWIKFVQRNCMIVTVLVVFACYGFYLLASRKSTELYEQPKVSLILWEEFLFLLLFLLWTYVAGFSPAAYGTEKFMDYGFMAAMMRSDTLPFRDIWYSEGTVNYYYGGQYFATFLTKLSGTHVEQTYNLARTMIAGLSFTMPFSLVYEMTYNRNGRKADQTETRCAITAGITGILAGAAVSLAGNMHYVIYAKLLPILQKYFAIASDYSYWYPDSTRYIGYRPDVPDKTIHEYPCYSFVLGDLHAHVVNLLFVMTLLGILYAMILWVKRRKKQDILYKEKRLWLYLGVIGIFLGLYQWNNYWDYIIYFTVTLIVFLYAGLLQSGGQWKNTCIDTCLWLGVVYVISRIVVLPFTLNFITMVQGVGIAQNHSLLYQLLILWGLPVCIVLFYTVNKICGFASEEKRGKRRFSLTAFLMKTHTDSVMAMILGLCGVGLILIPELVYVKDIYGDGYSRANTMFKLTYQAFVMFGMAMAYMIVELIQRRKKHIAKTVGVLGLICLLATCGYFVRAVSDSMGNIFVKDNYQGLDATAFLENSFPEDAGGIRWLMENVEGQQVVLEAQGDSYSDCERVTAMTGLTTVCGWYVHEWLWRNDTDDLNVKSVDIKNIYTSNDRSQVEELLSQYGVSYIFVGTCEREKYEDIQEENIRSLGEIVYENTATGNYIVKVS